MMRLQRPRPLTSQPTVSVVIPCYNYGHYLPDAVRSATDLQPGVGVEVIVVDDASPDGSGDVARRLADADPRVRVLQHEHNRGHLQTYNDGLVLATGDHVVLLSADDLLAEGSLARATALMQHHPSVGFVYGLTDKFHDRPKQTSQRVRSWGLWSGREWYDGRIRRGSNPVLSPEVVMRRDLLTDLGFYDLHLPHTADMFLWLRAAQRMDVGRVNGPVQAHYRMHEQQMHWAQFGWTDDLHERLDTLLRAVEEDPDPTMRTEARRQQARRAIATDAVALAIKAHDQGREQDLPVADLVKLAQDVDPGITATATWRSYEALPHQGVLRSHAARATRFGRKGGRWLRTRRYGV